MKFIGTIFYKIEEIFRLFLEFIYFSFSHKTFEREMEEKDRREFPEIEPIDNPGPFWYSYEINEIKPKSRKLKYLKNLSRRII